VEISRKSIRYKRSDIKVFIIEGKDFQYVELVDISQQGLAIRLVSSLKLKKAVKIRINFNEDKDFELDGHVISKSIVQTEGELQVKKRVWSLFQSNNSPCTYSIGFDDVSNDFQSYLLRSNMEKRLKHHSQ
jgi:hypothetical protein